MNGVYNKLLKDTGVELIGEHCKQATDIALIMIFLRFGWSVLHLQSRIVADTEHMQRAEESSRTSILSRSRLQVVALEP